MNDALQKYWEDIPVGAENAITYDGLCAMWQCHERAARNILHELSLYDNGDDYILIRSSGRKGFYRTDNEDEIQAFKNECISRGRSVFAPVKKINRVLQAEAKQFDFENNMRLIRESRGLKQSQVCDSMKQYDRHFDASLLSKMENGVCLPTFYQLANLAKIYGCTPSELLDLDFIP